MQGDGATVPEDAAAAFPFLRRRGEVTLVGLSTAVASPPTFATGKLGRRQTEALGGVLGGLAPDACCVVLLHHPPVATMTDYRRRLVDADRFARALQRGRVDLVLCGHQHVFQLGALPTDGGARSTPVVGAPSASLHGGDRHHEGGYIIYDLERTPDGWCIDLELRRFELASGRFERVFKRRIQREADRAGVRLETVA
jgi:3',5'-cyclic AMP phosphodiesterase CpdA